MIFPTFVTLAGENDLNRTPERHEDVVNRLCDHYSNQPGDKWVSPFQPPADDVDIVLTLINHVRIESKMSVYS